MNKRVEVLITTMQCDQPKRLLADMNIQGDALIGNQCDTNKVEMFYDHDHRYKMFQFAERGVGLNRNNLLMRTTADYCLFGDDDVTYVDGYEELVKQYFAKYPDADVIVFNLAEKEGTRYVIKKDFRVKFTNFMRFGAARLAIRRSSIQTHGILFNTCFGGGAPYSNGEDTLFLNSCLKAGLHIYAVSCVIATLRMDRASSWFHGYDDKYFADKGLLYYLISRRWYRLLILQDAIRHKHDYDKHVSYLWHTMNRGVRDAKKRRFEWD